MSLIGTVANYGGKQPSNTQDIKQFVVGAGGSYVVWIYKKLPTGLQVITPADTKKPVYLNNDLYVNGSIYNTSDAILKENVVVLSESRKANMLHLKPVEYSFKADSTHQLHYGFIAQDVEKAIPELVRTRNDGSLAVDYPKLVALAFAAIKELSEKVKILEAK